MASDDDDVKTPCEQDTIDGEQSSEAPGAEGAPDAQAALPAGGSASGARDDGVAVNLSDVAGGGDGEEDEFAGAHDASADVDDDVEKGAEEEEEEERLGVEAEIEEPSPTVRRIRGRVPAEKIERIFAENWREIGDQVRMRGFRQGRNFDGFFQALLDTPRGKGLHG